MTETIKEPVKIAAKTFILTAKMKALIAVFSLLLVGGVYVLADPQERVTAAQKDPYTLEIQTRADTVNNAVMGVIAAQGKEPAYKFRVTCEDAVYIIRKKNLEADQENLKLTPEQRVLSVKYKAFLHEAYLVVDDCFNGKQADLTKMAEAKAKLI
jgi:hypothetical protein